MAEKGWRHCFLHWKSIGCLFFFDAKWACNSETCGPNFPILSQWDLSDAIETRVLNWPASNLYAGIPHSNNVTHEVWLRLADWCLRDILVTKCEGRRTIDGGQGYTISSPFKPLADFSNSESPSCPDASSLGSIWLIVWEEIWFEDLIISTRKNAHYWYHHWWLYRLSHWSHNLHIIYNPMENVTVLLKQVNKKLNLEICIYFYVQIKHAFNGRPSQIHTLSLVPTSNMTFWPLEKAPLGENLIV